MMQQSLAKIATVLDLPEAPLRVERRSMEPTLRPGDLLNLEKVTPSQLRIGDIVVYERQGVLVVHRLLAVGYNWLLSKGDALKAADAPVPVHALRGRVVGIPGSWLRRWICKAQVFRSHLSGDPFKWRWLRHELVCLNFAGIPLQLLVPPAWRTTIPSLAIYETTWGSVGSFNSWTLELLTSQPSTTWLKPQGVDYLVDIKSSAETLELRAQHFFASIDRRRKSVRLYVDGVDLQGSLENCLRIMLARLLPEQNGLLVHAAALTDGQSAWLCIGKSGSGKSTLAALGKKNGLRVLSDDLVCVRLKEGVWIVDGLPFKGAHPEATFSAGEIPLKAILTLSKGDEETLTPLATPHAVGELLASLPFLQQDAAVMQTALNVVEQLVTTVPAHRLKFRPLEGVWNFVLRELGCW